ncbi:hypothetical protein BDZ97DRAFT_1826202 [Flammula alnicola]|nr:hypothetical protein BDZ97DRAFT_1826202 [Flammula alnicola]
MNECDTSLYSLTRCSASTVNGGVVTLYYVSPPAPTATNTGLFSFEQAATTIVSVVGTGASGVTLFQVQEVQSLLVVHEPTTTITLISQPTTVVFTVEQGASTFHLSAPPSLKTNANFGQFSTDGLNVNCTLDLTKNEGACVREDTSPFLVVDGSGSGSSSPIFKTEVETTTTTYTGALAPFATVTVSSGASSRIIQGNGILFTSLLAVMTAAATL